MATIDVIDPSEQSFSLKHRTFSDDYWPHRATKGEQMANIERQRRR